MIKFMSAILKKRFVQAMYIILKIQTLEGKKCRFRWGGSLWVTSYESTLFANLSNFAFGTLKVNIVEAYYVV